MTLTVLDGIETLKAYFQSLPIVYIGEVCKRNRKRQQHETVLALATLGDVTQKGLFLFMLLHPRWPREVVTVTVGSVIMLTFANGNTALASKNTPQ